MMKMVFSFLKADLRQKSLLVWDWLFPFILMGSAALLLKNNTNGGHVLAGLLSFLMLQTFIFGVPFRISEYAESGMLRLIAEEGNPNMFLFGFLCTKIIMCIIQLILFYIFGIIVMNLNLSVDFFSAIIAIALGVFVLGSLSLLIGVSVNKQHAALGFSQMTYLVLASISGVFFPLERSPEIVKTLSTISPLTYLHKLLSNALNNQPNELSIVLIMVIIGVCLTTLSLVILNKKLNKRKRNIV